MASISRALRRRVGNLKRLIWTRAMDRLTAPRALAIPGSNLQFFVHSLRERGRIVSVRERWTIDWMRCLPPGAVLYDIGANIGITALIAAEDATREVQVVAIEPFPANYASLVRNIVHNRLQDRVMALPVGVGESTSVAPFYWSSTDAGAALHSFGSMIRPRTAELIVPVAKHDCIRYRLDDLVRLPNMPFPSHIKIDVDGGELEVLAGATAVLQDDRCRGLQIEVVDADEGRDRSRRMIEMLKGQFDLVAEHPHAFPLVRDLQFVRR